MHTSTGVILAFMVSSLSLIGLSASALEGYDSLTGKRRVVEKTDKTLVGTKQSIDAGEVIQRNSLGITILGPTGKLSEGQFSKPEQCIGKIAKIPLSCATCIDRASIQTPKRPVKTSKVVQAIAKIEEGEFVRADQVKVVEKPIPPEKTPVDWLSNLRDVVGRKAIKNTQPGQTLTENHFGKRGNIFKPEETKEFGINR